MAYAQITEARAHRAEKKEDERRRIKQDKRNKRKLNENDQAPKESIEDK